MSDFQPGDVVVCVDKSPKPEWVAHFRDPDYTRPLKVGAHYRVLDVLFEGEFVGLVVEGAPHPYPPERAWEARRFRRIDPASESFTRQIRACRPIKTKVTA